MKPSRRRQLDRFNGLTVQRPTIQQNIQPLGQLIHLITLLTPTPSRSSGDSHCQNSKVAPLHANRSSRRGLSFQFSTNRHTSMARVKLASSDRDQDASYTHSIDHVAPSSLAELWRGPHVYVEAAPSSFRTAVTLAYLSSDCLPDICSVPRPMQRQIRFQGLLCLRCARRCRCLRCYSLTSTRSVLRVLCITKTSLPRLTP